MKKYLLYLCVLVWACATVWSCGREEEHLQVSPSELWGVWVQESDTNYQWTYNSDGTGNLVHLGVFEEDDENNGDFTWTINNGDGLEVEFKGSGELGGIDIVKQYTIKSISATAMRWEDVYGRSTTFSKVVKS